MLHKSEKHLQSSNNKVNCKLFAWRWVTFSDPFKCVPLKGLHRQGRLDRCTVTRNCTHNWQSVACSDESRFCLFRNNYQRVGERAQSGAIWEPQTDPIPTEMVWRAISYDNRTALVVFQGTITARQYVDRLINPFAITFMNTIQNTI